MPKRLSDLEKLLMDFVWSHPGISADACREALEAAGRPLKESTVRTLLSRLEQKGYVTHSVEGRTHLYRAREARENVATEAVRQILDRFCGGSVEAMLVGLVDHEVIDAQELEALAQRIRRHKQGVRS